MCKFHEYLFACEHKTYPVFELCREAAMIQNECKDPEKRVIKARIYLMKLCPPCWEEKAAEKKSARG